VELRGEESYLGIPRSQNNRIESRGDDSIINRTIKEQKSADSNVFQARYALT